MIEAAQIDEMSNSERLQAMEQLWDAMCREQDAIPSPAWHEDVLNERKERAERGDAKFLTLEQLKSRLQATG